MLAMTVAPNAAMRRQARRTDRCDPQSACLHHGLDCRIDIDRQLIVCEAARNSPHRADAFDVSINGCLCRADAKTSFTCAVGSPP
ncbi:hypothetical protein FHT08_000141 [Xanthomonas campestris]|uniref:hypothetical protein n=1 Tax=Xanthomonas sp. CFBP 8151 TaxID=3035310 RepID=UPI00141B52C1|nr:hypothetical protein [Xanthomonas sp. CFBP 8151]NIJ75093.1 hypothetical protein [Xanthomonas sp. CFBP 8151]